MTTTTETDMATNSQTQTMTEPMELAMWFGDEAEIDLRVGGAGAMTWENHGRMRCGLRRSTPHACWCGVGSTNRALPSETYDQGRVATVNGLARYRELGLNGVVERGDPT